METINALFSRKSIRNYTGKKISEDKLNEILKAAKAAPVGMGKYDAVHLTVIENPELLQDIDAAAAKMFGNPDMHPLYGAPTFVIVSAKTENETPNNTEFSNAAIMAHNCRPRFSKEIGVAGGIYALLRNRFGWNYGEVYYA